MIGDALVFDGVAHPFNFEADNARGPAGQMFSNHLYAFHNVLTPPGQPLMSAEEFLHKWTVEEIHEMVYGHSDTDMLVAMPAPAPSSSTTCATRTAVRCRGGWTTRRSRSRSSSGSRSWA